MKALKGLFWRWAHAWFHYRDPSRFWEFLWYCWSAIFGLAWAFALVTNWSANTDELAQPFKAALFVTVPLCIGLALRRIRNEKAKGGDALYRKRVSYNG